MTTHLTDTQKQTIRIALATWEGLEAQEEADGSGFWCLMNTKTGRQLGYHNGLNADHAFAVLAPQYASNLNACHAIEVKLTDEQYKAFHNTLYIITSADDAETFTEESRRIVSASAEHRALALYRALNLGELGD